LPTILEIDKATRDCASVPGLNREYSKICLSEVPDLELDP